MAIANSNQPASDVAPLTMEAYRNAAFRHAVALRLQAGKAEGKPANIVAEEIANEQRAIASAIVTPEFIEAAAAALLQSQQTIAPNARYQSTPASAAEAMRQIMQRRAAEAAAFAAAVAQPDYYQKLASMPPDSNPITPSLHEVKLHEVLDDLLHRDANGAPQVIAHIDATAKGAMLEHDELAATFAADGMLHKPLMEALAKQLPAVSQARIHALTLEWLGARAAAAKATSDLASNEGEAYRQAVALSTQWHRAPHATTPSTVVATAGLHTDRSPAEIEKEKTKLQRAEDISYTINHALSCGATDIFLQPLLAATFGVNVGCDPSQHGHAHGHDHDHAHTKPKMTVKSFVHEAGHYLKGEIFGDFVAVPLTIAVQRFAPGFMHGLQKILEPAFGWAFRLGANHSAKQWAKREGLAADDAQVAAHAEAVYQHEITHLPQAVVWNMFSYPIGAIGQKLGGHKESLPTIFKAKLLGMLVSNGLLIGGRILAPGAAQKWDQVTGEKIFLPVTKTVGKVFGVDAKTTEAVIKKDLAAKKPQWSERVSNDNTVTSTTEIARS